MSESLAGLRVTPDPEWAWTALIITGIRFGVVCSVFGGIYGASGEAGFAEALAVTFAYFFVLTVGTGVVVAVWWWCGPGRIRYVVAEGELRVLRGSRVIRRHPCADITFLEVVDGAGWRDVFLRDWGRGRSWPQLRVDRANWPTPRLLIGPRVQPRILLWGRDHSAEAERALREAVVAHGAVLRDEA